MEGPTYIIFQSFDFLYHGSMVSAMEGIIDVDDVVPIEEIVRFMSSRF